MAGEALISFVFVVLMSCVQTTIVTHSFASVNSSASETLVCQGELNTVENLFQCVRICTRDAECRTFEYRENGNRFDCVSRSVTRFRESFSDGQQYRKTSGEQLWLASTNIALKKPAYQSSTWDGLAIKAVDGFVISAHWSHTCSHTNIQNAPWWYVDLGQTCEVHSVTISNRQDCCQDRLINFDVAVTKATGTAFTSEERCYYHQDAMPLVLTLPCANVLVGRYVMIKLRGGGILTLCEVVVHGACC